MVTSIPITAWEKSLIKQDGPLIQLLFMTTIKTTANITAKVELEAQLAAAAHSLSAQIIASTG